MLTKAFVQTVGLEADIFFAETFFGIFLVMSQFEISNLAVEQPHNALFMLLNSLSGDAHKFIHVTQTLT
jgi:hypothetical protein